MDRIRRLHNPVRHYEWGSRHVLAEFTGRVAPSPRPEAELWMGAHRSAPSAVETDDRSRVPLDAWIRRDPIVSLGDAVARRFDGELPFLMKVLAPARALSIQTHPDAARARRGYERENAAGLALDDPRRNYRDPNPKPELICSLSGFRALCGLRPRSESAALFDALGIGILREWAAPLLGRDTGAYREFLRRLLTCEAPRAAELAEQIAQAARRCGAALGNRSAPGEAHGAMSLVAELSAQYPGDLGIVAPLFLNFVELAPGEALFLGAGTLHSYLGGVGVEVMANSDNVLRCGLTSKHVDPTELLEALDTDEGRAEPLRPTAAGPGAARIERYASPTPHFELARLELEGSECFEAAPEHGPEIWLCTRGRAHLRDARGHAEPVGRGEALWVPAGAGAYRVEPGAARDAAAHTPAEAPQFFRAGVPR